MCFHINLRKILPDWVGIAVGIWNCIVAPAKAVENHVDWMLIVFAVGWTIEHWSDTLIPEAVVTKLEVFLSLSGTRSLADS